MATAGTVAIERTRTFNAQWRDAASPSSNQRGPQGLTFTAAQARFYSTNRDDRPGGAVDVHFLSTADMFRIFYKEVFMHPP